MQFLSNYWLVFLAITLVFFFAFIFNFLKTGKDVLSEGKLDSLPRGIGLHFILAGACIVSGIPALIGVIAALIHVFNSN